MGFHKKTLGKAYFIVKMTGPAMIRLSSSDFWKAPLAGSLFLVYSALSRVIIFRDKRKQKAQPKTLTLTLYTCT